MTTDAVLRLGVVMGTEIGLLTQYLNLKHALSADDSVEARMTPVFWWKERGAIERLPMIANGTKAHLRARFELAKGMLWGARDALLIGSYYCFPGLEKHLSRQPYFLTLDVTTRQMYGELAPHYGLQRKFDPGSIEKIEDPFYQHATMIFPWSEWARRSLVEDYEIDPARVRVVPAGVDTDRMRPGEPREHSRLRILFVGGDFRRKGGDLLIDWANTTRLQNWELHIVTRDEISCLPPGCYLHHGIENNSDALVELYRKCDIFVLPTRADASSISTIEAMACGLPVIIGSTGGTPEIVEHEKSGFLVRSGDGSDMKRRLEHLMLDRDLLFRMGTRARSVALNKFDANKNTQQLLQCMRESL